MTPFGFRLCCLLVLVSLGVAACAVPSPRPVQTAEVDRIQPKAALEQEKAVPPPGPPPFTEKLAPVVTGLEKIDRLFSLNFDNAQLGAVLQSLVGDTDISLSVESGVDLTRPVTVHSRNSTLAEALDLVVVKGAGYAWKSTGSQLEINRFEERLYVFDYLDLTGETSLDVGGDMLGSSIQDSGVAGKFQITAKREKVKGDIWEQVQKALEGIRSADGRLQINPRSGLIYLEDTPRKIASMVAFLDNMSVSLKRQVLIEAKILEVQLRDSQRYGIDWSSLGAAIKGDFLFDIANFNLNNNGRVIISSELDTSLLTAAVDFLQTQGDVSVLSNPHISVLNGQSAVMTVGSQFPFTDISGVTRDEDTDEVTIDATIKRAVFGVQLGITPQIARDGIITVNVVPTITRNEGEELVEVPTGTSEVVSFSNPVIGLQEMATTVRVRSGQAIIIGGLIAQEKVSTTSALPGFGRLPIFKYFFGNQEYEARNRELVIILQPHIKEVI